MTRFGDSANGPSVLDISNISGVSLDIATLAGFTTELSNLGPVSAEIGRLGTAAAVADLALLSSQATVDDLAALADLTSELALLGTTAMADASTGHIQALATSTVGATSQLSIDALGQLVTEIGLLGNNLTTLQNSAANSPIQISNLSDVTFTNLQNGEALVYNSTSGDWENGAVSGGSISTSNITEVAAATPTAAGEVIHYDGISAWTVGRLDYNEILNPPSLQPLATTAAFADLNEAAPSGTAGDVIHHDGSIWTQGQLASTELSDTSTLVRNNASSNLSGDYSITGNLDVSQEIRVSTIDPDPDGNTGTLTILGNLQVDGTTTTINSATLTVNDKSVTLSTPTSGNTTFSAMNGAGIDVDATGMSTVWTTNVPAITYSTNSSGNAADAQTWNINRGVVAEGWSDGATSYDGQLTLNCSANSHGITIKSAPHSDNATYELVLPATTTGAGGKVLAQNSGNTQLEFVDVVKPASAAALASLTTVVDSTNVDVRTAKDFQQGTAADIVGGATLYNATAAITLTMDTTKLGVGDIATIYAGNGNVTIAQDATYPFTTIKIDGNTTASTGNRTIASGSLATITVVSSGVAVIAGQGVS